MRRELLWGAMIVGLAGLASAANFGTAIPVIGAVGDIAFDDQRQVVYISNMNANRIEVFSIPGQRMLTPINIGNTPAGLAISPDRSTLYIANSVNLGSISSVDLASGALKDEVSLGSRPDSLFVGSDGQVVIIGTAGLLRLNPGTRVVTPVPISPPPANPPGLPTPGGTPAANFRARLAGTPNGNLVFGLSANRLFIYEVASGTVLRSRNVVGLNSPVSVAPDGSRFMAGPFLFDTATLTILGRAGLVAANLTGGSVFSVDGNSVYASFSTQTAINPFNPNNPQIAGAVVPAGTVRSLGVLQVLKSSNLTQQLGLRMPDIIADKVILSADGQNLFAISNTGLLWVPIGTLSSQPIAAVEKENLVLAVDICNRTVQSVNVNITNAGRGRMTYSAQVLAFGALTANPATAPPAVLSQATGIAPAALRITFDPRSLTSASRGTTLATIQIVAPEAVNIEPTITVSLNFRDVDQHGAIYPSSGLVSGSTQAHGLTDLLVDSARGRVYLSNSVKNQVEIFSIASQTFLPPIEVGASPRSMALVGSNLMVVANNSSENVSVIDLDLLQQVDLIPLGPVAITTAPLFPNSVAVSSNAILFSTIPLAPAGATPGNGNIWQLSLASRTAYPRLDLGIVNGTATVNSVDSRTALVAPSNGSSIALVSAATGGTLRLYDPGTDAFPIARTNQFATLRGAITAMPDGSAFVVDQTVFSSSLAVAGTITGTTGTFTQGVVGSTGNVLFRVRTGATGANADTRFQLERLNANLSVTQSSPMPEAVIASPYAPRGTVQLLPRAMSIDSPTGNSYALTVSGLSVVPLAVTSGSSPTFTATQVVNAASFASGAAVAPGSIISIFGTALGDLSAAPSVPLPTTLGGTCVLDNDVPLPLFFVSPGQINAQLPPTAIVGTTSNTLTVRSLNSGRSSSGVAIRTQASNPGIFTVTDSAGRRVAAIFNVADFSLVTQNNAPSRDQRVVLYATGLGATTPQVAAGVGPPSSPLAVTGPVQVCIGRHPMVVEFSGLAPGLVGVYQLNLYVPGDRVQGDNLPVVLTMGTADCSNVSTTGAPVTSIR